MAEQEALSKGAEANTPLIDENVTRTMGAIPMTELLDQPQTLPEISPERAITYEDRDESTVYGVFCSDDRNGTPESTLILKENYGINGEVFIRVYGGLAGTTRRLAAAIATQYGPEALTAYGTSFTDFVSEVKTRIEAKNKVKLGAHSAESNEDNSTDLNFESEKGLGCAYCAGVGAVTCLCQPSSSLTKLAKSEQAALLGDDTLVGPVTEGNIAVEQQFFAEEKDSFSVSRSDIKNLGVPVMILEGSHAPANEVEVVLNLQPGKVSNPKKANEVGVPLYSVDAAIEAEILIKAFPELQLNPRILLAVIDHDARAVREALASHEGLHADSMKLTKYGDIEQTISYLEGIQQAA